MQGYHTAPLGNAFEQDPSQYSVYTLRNMFLPTNMYARSLKVFLMQGYHARVLLSGACSFSVLLLCLSFVCHMSVICLSCVCQLSVMCHLSVMCLSFVCHLYVICQLSVMCLSCVCHLFVICLSCACHL